MSVQEWRERKRPCCLEKRYEFESYDALRDFLDDAADLSEQTGLYPDIGFGTSHANFTIHVDEGNEELTDKERDFAQRLDSLDSAPHNPTSGN